MKILFINYSKVPDMTESFLYDGLIEILGRESVVDWPMNPWWHSRFQPSAGVLGAVTIPETDCKCKRYKPSDILTMLEKNDFDLVILGESLTEVDEAYERLRKDDWNVPVVRLDGFDDQYLHGARPEVEAYFKREAGHAPYSDSVYPMPVSIPFSRFPQPHSDKKEVDVSFICTPCTAARKRVDITLQRLSKKLGFSYSATLSKPGQHHTFGDRVLTWSGFIDAIAASKISVTISAWPEDQDGFHQSTDFRYFEIPAAGTSMIGQVPSAVVPHDFEPYEEYWPIRSKQLEASNLEDGIRFGLAQEGKREQKAALAEVRARKYHSTQARAEQFLDVVKERCGLT